MQAWTRDVILSIVLAILVTATILCYKSPVKAVTRNEEYFGMRWTEAARIAHWNLAPS